MKKILKLSWILCLLGIVFTSCGSDNDDDKGDNGNGNGDGNGELIAPENLTSIPKEDMVTLAWKTVATADSYKIVCNGEEKTHTGTSVVFMNLESDKEYEWKIQALRGEETSEWATGTFTTLLQSPRNLTEDLSVLGEVTLTWSNTIDVDGYELVFDGGDPIELTENTYTTSVVFDETYTWNVKACRGESVSAGISSNFTVPGDNVDRTSRWAGNWNGIDPSVNISLMNRVVPLDEYMPSETSVDITMTPGSEKNEILLQLSGLDDILGNLPGLEEEASIVIPEISAKLSGNLLSAKKELDINGGRSYDPAVKIKDIPELKDIFENIDMDNITGGLGGALGGLGGGTGGSDIDPMELKVDSISFNIKEIILKGSINETDTEADLTTTVNTKMVIKTDNPWVTIGLGFALSNVGVEIKSTFTKED